MRREGKREPVSFRARLTRREVLAGVAAALTPRMARSAPPRVGAATFREYQLPFSSYPIGITRGPDGAVWFAMAGDAVGGGVGRITISGAVTLYQLPLSKCHDIVTGPDGNLWYTRGTGGIGRMTPQGIAVSYSTPGFARGYGIARGPNGTIWYTGVAGDRDGRVGRIVPPDDFMEWGLPPLLIPRLITEGPDGNMWFTEEFTPSIGRITPSGSITIFPFPSSLVGAIGITRGADGNIWYTAGQGSLLPSVVGRMTTTGSYVEFPVNPGSGWLGSIVAAPDGHLWTSVDLRNALLRVSYSGDQTEFPLPQANSSPLGIAVGPDSNLWFTEFLGNRIAVVILSTTPVELVRFTAE